MIFLYVLDDETPGDWRLGGASRWWLHKSLEGLGRACSARPAARGAPKGSIAEVLARRGATVHFTRDYAPWSRGWSAA